jgi:GAF domain-containing protein
MKSIKINHFSRNLFLTGISFLVISVALGIYVALVVSKISNYGNINNRLNELQITAGHSTVAVKEFLLNAYTDEGFVKIGSNASYNEFNSSLAKSIQRLDEISTSWFVDTKIKKEKTARITRSLENYRKHFNELTTLFVKKGFKDLGLEGDMRKAIHFVENYEKGINKEMLLTLRRHEKDFLLRKDPSYIEKFDKDFIKFKEWIQNNKAYEQADIDAIIPVLTDYKVLFHQIADIENTIGLKPTEGLRQKISMEYAIFGKELSELSNDAKREQTRLAGYAWLVNMALITLFAILITVTILSVIYFKKEVSKPIEALNAAADEIAKGHLSVSLDQLKSKWLVTDIVAGFEKLIGKLRHTITQIEDISSRKMIEPISLNSNEDEIGLSLNKIIDQINTYDEDERKRKWSTEGFAKFSEIIRNSASVKELASVVTTELVKYLGANQSGFFILEEANESRHLELLAAYAYDRKKYIHKRVAIGEGLIGQCFLENDTIFLTDVPESYLSITSGLGSAKPRCVIITPFKVNDRVEAVFEIAFFKVPEPYQVTFLEKIGETIASSISGLRMNERTNVLLAESIQQAQERKSQEEEMRQNMEELAATQEEYYRNEKVYLEKVNSLEMQIEHLTQENRNLGSIKADLEKAAIDYKLRQDLKKYAHN